MNYLERIKRAHDKIEIIETAIYEDLEEELIQDLHRIFDWWIVKFPKRKNDLEFYSGMGMAGWRIHNYKSTYMISCEEWEYKKEVEIIDCMEEMYNFFDKVHEIGQELHYGYPMDIGIHSTRNYILEKENTNPNK